MLLSVLQLLHMHLLLLLQDSLLLLNLLLNKSLLLQLGMLSRVIIIEKSRGLVLYFDARSFTEKRRLWLLLHGTCESKLRHIGTFSSKFSCIILKKSIIPDYSLLYLFQLLGRLIVIIQFKLSYSFLFHHMNEFFAVFSDFSRKVGPLNLRIKESLFGILLLLLKCDQCLLHLLQTFIRLIP